MYSPKFLALVLAIGGGSLGLMPGTAQAQESVAEQLQRINESIALLSARKQELELQAQVASKEAEISRIRNAGSGNEDQLSQPIVKSIEGADGKLSATLAFASGRLETVRQGASISGGWKVSKISVDAVHLKRGGQNLRLSYGHEPPAPVPTAAMAAVPPLSPLIR